MSQPSARPETASSDQIAAADAAGHKWFVLETRTGRIIFTDHTCRGARSFATHIAGRPTLRVRAGLYGVGMGRRQSSLTITTRDEAIARQQGAEVSQ